MPPWPLLAVTGRVGSSRFFNLIAIHARFIATTDFFPPVVDDPYAFGAIAAANALSDVYAMGGEVLFAINLAAFPDNLELAILTEILRGGADKVRAPCRDPCPSRCELLARSPEGVRG